MEASKRDYQLLPPPQILRDGKELVGILEDVRPFGDGLQYVKIAGLERLIPEEVNLDGMKGKRISILRIGGHCGAGVWE